MQYLYPPSLQQEGEGLMLFQSVHQSIADYKRSRRARRTRQSKMTFRWKFIILGLGVILVILIGILSQFIKRLTSLKQVPINTTFLNTLLPMSQFFFTDLNALKYFVSGVSISDSIKFDNTTSIYRGNSATGQQVSRLLQDKQDMLYLFEVEDQVGEKYKFGMFLHQYFPVIDYGSNQTVSVPQGSDNLVSTVFSLSTNYSKRLDTTPNCQIYNYRTDTKQLQFLQLINMNEQTPTSGLRTKINNYQCFDQNVDKRVIQQQVRKLFGFDLSVDGQIRNYRLNRVEVYGLTMDFVVAEGYTRGWGRVVDRVRERVRVGQGMFGVRGKDGGEYVF